MANTHINQFIQSLSEDEIKLVEDYLQKLKPLIESGDGEEIKYLKLFRLLINNKNRTVTDEEIVKVTGTGRAGALKSNLYQKVLESFSFDKYLTDVKLFNENDIILFILKKKLLVYNVILRSQSKGKTEALYELLNEIIDTAKEYEIYDLLVEALISKKYFKGIRTGIKEFEKIIEEIKFYEYCAKALHYAADCYYRLTLNIHFIKSLSNKELDKYLSSSIKQMESDYKKTKSEHINYYFHIINYAVREQKKDYLEALKLCNKIISLLKKNKVIYRKERMGFILDNISQLKTYLGDYEAAAIDAKKAQEYYIIKSRNYVISKEQEFYAYMYDNDIAQALKCTGELLEHSLIDTGEFLKSKYVYYQACVLFISNDFKGAWDLLKSSLEIEKDKTRWNVSLRILNIMIFIELDKINEAARSLESLRKYMERTSKEDEVKPRDVLIVKTLRELEKDGFEYHSGNATVTKMLKELSAKDTPVSWEHYTPELVPFHKWLEGKRL